MFGKANPSSPATNPATDLQELIAIMKGKDQLKKQALLEEVRANPQPFLIALASKKPDILKANIPEYRLLINLFRVAIQAQTARQAALDSIASIDGLMSFPVLMTILQELKARAENHLDKNFKLSLMPGDLTAITKAFEAVIDGIIKNKKVISASDVQKHVKKVVDQKWEKAAKNEALRTMFDDYMATYIFLVCALEVYAQTDEKQTLGYAALRIKMMMLSQQKIEQPFIGLSYCASHAYPVSQDVPLWQELILWLEGLYYRIYNQIPKEKIQPDGIVQREEDGCYPRVDKDDVAFCSHFKLTKFRMSMFHHEIAAILQAKLSLQPVLHLVNHLHCAAAAAASGDVPVDNDPGSLYEQPAIMILEEQGARRLVITLTDSEVDKAKIEEIRRFADSVLSQKLTVIEEDKFREELADLPEDARHDVDMRILQLMYCVNKYALTSSQKEKLAFLGSSTEAFCKSYINGGGMVHFCFARTHAALAEETIKKVQETNDRHVQLNAIFALRTELVKENSTGLIVSINQILINAHDSLAGKPRPQLEIRR